MKAIVENLDSNRLLLVGILISQHQDVTVSPQNSGGHELFYNLAELDGDIRPPSAPTENGGHSRG